MFLYAVAGVGQVDQRTVHFDSVEYAPILPGGAVGAWKLATFDIKGGRSEPAAFIEAGRLYVCGGWGDRDSDDIYSDVQYTSLNNNGDIDPWQTSTSILRARMYGHSGNVVNVGNSGVYSILVGGTLGEGNVIPFIQYARVHDDGSVGSWMMARKTLNHARWGHATVIIGSRMYVSGGASSGAAFLEDVQYLNISKP